MYYSLELDWNPKVIGVRNGVYQLELDESQYESRDLELLKLTFTDHNLLAKKRYPKIGFPLYFKKLKLAKETTFMSFSPNLIHCLFLVQTRLLEVFNLFNFQEYKVYETVISDFNTKTVNKSYHLFYTVIQDWDVINFEGSIFTSGGFGNIPHTDHHFSSEKELKEFNGILKLKTLALSKKFDPSLDLFHTRLGGVFISERLKNALEEQKVSGVIFKSSVRVVY